MNRNSALRWFPPLQAAGLPVPQTVFVPYSHYGIMPIFDGQPCPEMERLSTEVVRAAEDIGFPVFIRTDLASAKHSGPKAFSASTRKELPRALFLTLEDNEMNFFMEREGPQAIMVRRFLNLSAQFTAFHGLPISREWRFFSDGERIICRHPYWPKEALEGHIEKAALDYWEDLLERNNRIPEEIAELEAMAIEAAAAQGGGSWSLDFAQDADGKWWLLDCAVMQDSFHWPGCPNAVEESHV